MTRHRRDERGFALLMVFVMAAVIAITLYTELPRVAFESQRAREQLLVDRGNEYKRGIQLFYRKLKRFPMKIEDLESTNNIRFLRRRYRDPLTGKDEWRLIHVGPGGFLTDSLVQKPNPLGKDQKDVLAGSGSPGNTPSSTDASQQAAPQLNANGTEGGGINMATARRPSDHMMVVGPGGGVTLAQPTDPNQPPPPQYAVQTPSSGQYIGQQPSGPPQIAGQPPQYPGQPPQYPGQPPQYPGQPQYPPQFPGGPPFGRGIPTSGQPIQPGQPGQPLYPQLPGGFQVGQGQSQPIVPQQPYPGQAYPGQPQLGGGQFPSAQNPNIPPPGSLPGFGGTAPNAALVSIQNTIFGQRQPPAGLGGTPDNSIGVIGGIAGVASTYKGEGIKRVNDKKKYQEWEFVYDLKQDKTVMGNAAGQQLPQQPQGPGPGNTPLTPFQPNTPPNQVLAK